MGDLFGSSVAISGTRVVVGAQSDDAGAADTGSAYIYDIASGTPSTPIVTLNNPGPAAAGYFGNSAAVDGNLVVLGAFGDDTTAMDAGATYIFGPVDGDNDGLRDNWEIMRFGTQYGHGPLDDDDHDGIVNLLELAFGFNPTAPNGGVLAPAVPEDGYLTMTLTKQPGVTYEVQSAGTLLPSLPDSFSASTTTILINDTTTLKVRDNTLFGTPPARFMRVQVTGAP